MGQAFSDDSSRQKLYESGKFDVLRAQLAALGATTPLRVYGKRLSAEAQTDFRHGLLPIGGELLTVALTDGELGTVVDHFGTGGLDVPVFDRDGTRYDFKCVSAEDRGFYRLAAASESEFERFMVDNTVVSDAADLGKDQHFMEVWVFRSPALRKGRKPVDSHRDGALGMVVLFFDDLDTEGLEDDVFDEDNGSILHLLRHCLKSARVGGRPVFGHTIVPTPVGRPGRAHSYINDRNSLRDEQWRCSSMPCSTCHEHIRWLDSWNTILTAAATASPPSVITYVGQPWWFDVTKARSSQTKESTDWSEVTPQPRTTGVQWWLSPTKGTNGSPYWSVLYVVSNTTQYSPSAQKRCFMRLSASNS
ncbi:hypothetical protein EJB05_35368, partial [Eragrostis curvula]